MVNVGYPFRSKQIIRGKKIKKESAGRGSFRRFLLKALFEFEKLVFHVCLSVSFWD